MLRLSILIAGLILFYTVTAQNDKKKPVQKEKPPTQKEMEEMMKEAEKTLGEMSPEDKKMMDSLGIKMPSFNNMPKVSDKQLAKAWEDENLIVPRRDAGRIASIPKAVADAKMQSYITAIQRKISETLKSETSVMVNKVYDYVRANSRNNAEAGNMASALWIAGKPELSLLVMGKICAGDAGNTDNLSNFSAMLSMLGAQHLAIPILNNLNAKFPKNSTLLNNLGQAWFGLGEISKAEKYLDSAIALYAYHPQANLTIAAIEEHRGNIEKAREALKRSIKHSYSKEKEEKLAKQGHKLNEKDFRMPVRTKADPMNLGSFQAPGFPKSVEECVQAEKEWRNFYEVVDEKIDELKRQKEQANEAVMMSQQQRINEDLTLIKTAMANPGLKGNLQSVPMFAGRAGKKLEYFTDLHRKKLEGFLKKVAVVAQGEWNNLKTDYVQRMAKLKKEDADQTGEGLPNKEYCPKYKEASDNYLKVINPQLQELYMESLKLQKEFLNESAYWYLYIQWPDMYEVTKLGFQIEWLETLKKGLGISGFGSGFPFVSITQYLCNKEEKEPGKTKLQKFNDIACQYNDTMDLKIVTFYNNCSRMTSKFNLKFVEYSRIDDFERAEGDTYISSTVKVSVEKGFDKMKWEKGPIKVEAKVGASIEFEFDREGVKDVTLSVEAKAGAGHNVYDTGLEEGGSIGGKDVIDTTIEIGVEGRISIISGHGRIGGTGKLDGIKITEW